MKSGTIFCAAAALVIAGVGIAHAQSAAESGWYAGLDVGYSDPSMSGSDIDSALANQGITGSSSIDRHDTSVGASIGYRFNRNFALEGGYEDFGKFNDNTTVVAPAADTIQGNYKAHAWSLAAIGNAPLGGGWSLYGKLGVTRTHADLSLSSASGATAPASTSASRSGLLVGAGASYDFSDNVFGKLELDRYTNVGDSSTGSGDMNLLTLGVGYRF